MKKLFSARVYPVTVDGAIFGLRLVCGLAFVLHGWGKIQNPMAWMGPEAPVPGVLQLLAAVSEFGGGLAWILGLLTPLASLGVLSTMTVAAAFHISNGDPFVSQGGPAWELAGVYWMMAVFLILAGPGGWSLDRRVFGARK